MDVYVAVSRIVQADKCPFEPNVYTIVSRAYTFVFFVVLAELCNSEVSSNALAHRVHQTWTSVTGLCIARVHR